ncbi:unnamed protein product, partial [Rotaria sordida]
RLRQNRCAELDSSTTDLFHNVQWIMCQHSELCAGFVLYENDQAILSFSGDSGFNASFYKFLWTAPTILVDDRATCTYAHASFDEILNFYNAPGEQRQVFVYHYGLENEKSTFPIDSISAISLGQDIQLILPQ